MVALQAAEALKGESSPDGIRDKKGGNDAREWQNDAFD